MKLRYLLPSGRAQCHLGWRDQQCQGEAVWAFSGDWWLACERCKPLDDNRRRLTPTEAVALANRIALERMRPTTARPTYGAPWKHDERAQAERNRRANAILRRAFEALYRQRQTRKAA